MIYPRPHPAEFAIDAPESEIQAFPDWARGLGIAFDETNGFPEMTGINGLFQIITEYIKYLEQNGFAEWTASLEYPIGAGVRVGSIWYRAKTQNTNKPPATSQNDWAVFLNASDITYADPIQVDSNGQVKIKDATTTQKGVARFANNTEIANKSNVSSFINPNNAATIAQSTDVGVGQTWQNLTSSRVSGSTYTNTTVKPIQVAVTQEYDIGYFYINGQQVAKNGNSANNITSTFSFIIPVGSTYRFVGKLNAWWELR